MKLKFKEEGEEKGEKEKETIMKNKREYPQFLPPQYMFVQSTAFFTASPFTPKTSSQIPSKYSSVMYLRENGHFEVEQAWK